MSTVNETSILLRIGPRSHRLHCSRKSWESGAEYSGRLLCYIESKIRKLLDLERSAAIPAGIRFATWTNDGHRLGRFWAHGFGAVEETTGQPYQDRTRRIPGIFNIEQAKRALTRP